MKKIEQLYYGDLKHVFFASMRQAGYQTKAIGSMCSVVDVHGKNQTRSVS